MRKILLFVCASLFACSSFAQEVEIFYPDFQYDTNKGFTKHNITIGYSASDLWKRSPNNIPAESELGYTRPAGNTQTSISAAGYGKPGTTYTPTDTYAVVDAVDLSAHASKAELKVTFFNMAQYALANNAKFSVLVTDNYTNDPTTTAWVDVTSQLDQIDDDVNYDGKWTKSTLILNNWKNSNAFVLAFRYQVTQGGTVDKVVESPTVDRPGLWRVSDVRFTASDTPTSIDDDVKIERAKLVYPNPATTFVNFSQEVKSVALYNINGSLLKKEDVSSHSMDIAEYPAGIYILKLTLENGTVITNKLQKR